jgi:hypothetical protein
VLFTVDAKEKGLSRLPLDTTELGRNLMDQDLDSAEAEEMMKRGKDVVIGHDAQGCK